MKPEETWHTGTQINQDQEGFKMVKVSGGYDQVWRRKPEVVIFDFGKVDGNPIE